MSLKATSSALQNRFLEVTQDQQAGSLTDVNSLDDLWPVMREEAERKAAEEPILGSYFHATILNHKSFGDALSFRLASKLDNPMLPTMLMMLNLTCLLYTSPSPRDRQKSRMP